ncbi:hypothetical protein PFISCL1PPCAC_23282, partial [Pristionchus fissidentatus]
MDGSLLISYMISLPSSEASKKCVQVCSIAINRKLRMSEVERLTTNLTEIGKAAANLKTAVPSVHGQSESDLLADMERLRGERNEATTAIDQSLRRCKALANIMVTMKKLAMVQDPAMQRIKQQSPSSSASSSSNSTNGSTPQAPPSHSQAPPPPSHASADRQSSIPPVPPSPVHYTSPTSSLDGQALREVSGTPPPLSAPPSGPTSASPVVAPPTEQPPRLPSRFSVRDARQRAPCPTPTLPPSSPSQGMAPQSSPIQATTTVVFYPDAESRRMRLEERQSALAEKQRLLHNQFQQLQQIAPN